MASEREIRNYMMVNRSDFNTATQLAEAALADFPTHRDEALVFDIAQEVFYADEQD